MEDKIEKFNISTNKIGIEDSYQILNDNNLSVKTQNLLYKTSKKEDDKIMKDIISKKEKVTAYKIKFAKDVKSAFQIQAKHKQYISFINKKRNSLKDNSLRGAADIEKQRAIIKNDIEKFEKNNNSEFLKIRQSIAPIRKKAISEIGNIYGLKPLKTPPKIYPITPIVASIKSYKPPFLNMVPYSKSKSWFMDNYTFSNYNSVSSYLGHVSQSSGLRNNKADNFDPAFVETESGFSFLYTVPVTGKIKVVLKATPWQSNHICYLVDEFGISDSFVYQYQFNGVHIISSSGTETFRHRKSDWWETGYKDGSWTESYLSSSSTLTDEWISQKAYTAGTDVLIKVHSLLQNLPTVNDVSVMSQMDFYWIFKEIIVSKG